MTVQSLRHFGSDPREPSIHELSPFRFEGNMIATRLCARHTDEGVWRARLLFARAGSDASAELETAEIFYALTQQELWQAVHDLREHHMRDLYRSLL